MAARGTDRDRGTGTNVDLTTDRLLMALLQLAVDDRESRTDENPKRVKTEVLLDRVGFTSSTIASLVGKQPGAVRTTLSREKTKKPKK